MGFGNLHPFDAGQLDLITVTPESARITLGISGTATTLVPGIKHERLRVRAKTIEVRFLFAPFANFYPHTNPALPLYQDAQTNR